MRNWLSLVVGLILVGLLLNTVINNTSAVTVVLPFLQWDTKLWAALLAAALVGAAASLLLVTWPLVRLKLESRRHARRIAQLEQEVHGLRTLPIASDSAASSGGQKV